VHELEERLNEVDRGAGAVLSDVRGVRERLDELSTVAHAAHEAAAGTRTDTEELRAVVARVTGEVDAARSQVEHASHEALGAREQAAAAGEAAGAAREDAGRAREEAGAMRRELDAGEERLTALGAEVERAATAAGAAAEAAGEAKADAAAARDAGERTAERLTDVETKAKALRTEMTAGRERLETLGDRVERLGRDLVESGQAAGTALEAQGAELRGDLTAARRVAEEARDTVETVRAEIEAVREQSLTARDDAAGARAAAESGDRRVEAMQAELTYALKTLEEVKAGLTSAGQAAVIARREAEQAKRAAQTAGDGNSGVHEVFQQLLAAARGGGPLAGDGPKLGRPSTPASDLRRKTETAAREPRHGFDDVARPLAILGLDGRFRELNPAFARLVGYQEQAFAKAAWPSPHDRAGYTQSQEQLRQLASGEIDSVVVQSTYMHGQGLMVPVVGTLKVVPGEDGLPVHLLLEAEERHTG
jgi:chromosome segregation ATPase